GVFLAALLGFVLERPNMDEARQGALGIVACHGLSLGLDTFRLENWPVGANQRDVPQAVGTRRGRTPLDYRRHGLHGLARNARRLLWRVRRAQSAYRLRFVPAPVESSRTSALAREGDASGALE